MRSIAVAVRRYLRYGLSYRHVEERLAERGGEVDHVSIYRWVSRSRLSSSTLLDLLAMPPGDRWFVAETYVKVTGRWTYLYRTLGQHGQVIAVLVGERRHGAPARACFTRAMTLGPAAVEITTDRARVYPRVLDDLAPAAWHVVEQYPNNVVDVDHGRLKARLRPMRGLTTIRSARTIAAGPAFIQNRRRGHYEHTTNVASPDRVRVAFGELALRP